MPGPRIGASLTTSHPARVGAREGARWLVARAAACREAGLDSLFVGDHHGTGPANYYQNVPVMGRLLAEWGDAPAGILAMLPLWHPVLLLEERLDVVRRLTAGEEVDGLRIAPVPAEPLEVWIGAEAPPAIERAARLGDGFLTMPSLSPADAAKIAARYLDAARRHDRAPTAVAIRRDIHVGADAADAERVASPVLAKGYRGFPPEAPVVGGPEQVAEAFAALGDAGYTDVIVRHLSPDQDEVLASTARLAEVRALLGHR